MQLRDTEGTRASDENVIRMGPLKIEVPQCRVFVEKLGYVLYIRIAEMCFRIDRLSEIDDVTDKFLPSKGHRNARSDLCNAGKSHRETISEQLSQRHRKGNFDVAFCFWR